MNINLIREQLYSLVNFYKAEYERDIKRMDSFREVLESLPEGSGNVIFGEKTAILGYSPLDKESSTELVRELRGILHVQSSRHPTENGSLVWKLTKEVPDAGTLNITVSHATLAPGCKLVPKEVTRVIFEVVCDDDEE